MKEIFFATGNENKIREIQQILGDRFVIKSFRDSGKKLDIEETEPDLAGNALLKARAYAEATGLPTFADDTGLEVYALDMRPGVQTARYAGPENDAGKNMTKLLRELDGVADRRAQFRTAIAWIDGGEELIFEGILEGNIATAMSGSEGFGYDPVFIPDGFAITLADMTAAEKNEISHRSRAVNKLADFLQNQS